MQLVMCDEMSLRRRDIICCHQPFSRHIQHNLLPAHSFAHTNQFKSGFHVTLTAPSVHLIVHLKQGKPMVTNLRSDLKQHILI